MRVRVLGCSGAIAKDCRTTSFLVDSDVLVDAGTGVGDLSLQEMLGIRHVLLTHSHLDHVAAALVVPSADEGLGLVAVEAMLCETPVVAFESGGIPDVVQHERTGLLVTERSPDALAAAIERLLERDDRGAALGAAGRLHAVSTFAPESVARRYLDIYRTAIATAPT
jgi:glycogen synthase